MSALRIEPVGESTLADWRHVHNLIIPTAPLSLNDVRERLVRNRLDVAYRDDVLVGCSTVRPPAGDIATVIVHVLPAHRRRGYGAELLAHPIGAADSLPIRLAARRVLHGLGHHEVLETVAGGLVSHRVARYRSSGAL